MSYSSRDGSQEKLNSDQPSTQAQTKVATQFSDNRATTAAQLHQQTHMSSSPVVTVQRGLMKAMAASSVQQQKPNNTGLPDQLKCRVKPTMQMKPGVPVNDDVGLEAEADVMGAKAMTAGSQQPVQAANILNPTSTARLQRGPVQRYVQEGDTAISENGSFAVKNDGKPNSELYMATPEELPALANVEKEIGGVVTIAGTQMTQVIMQSEKNKSKNEGGALHCGPFARNIMPDGKGGNDKDASVGNHLHMSSVEVPGTPWSNHFAAVIAQDGGDRATFETAVGLKHMYFGIYGAEGVQTFRHKTMVAGIMLGIETDNTAILKDLNERNEIEKQKGFIGYDKEIALMKGDVGNAKTALAKIQSARELKNEEGEIIALKEALEARSEAYKEMEEEKRERDAARDKRHRLEDDEREREIIAKDEKARTRKKILWTLAILAVSALIIAFI